MTLMYFATDGNFGDAQDLVVLDVTGEEDRYAEVYENLSEGERYALADRILKGFGSLDYQDCPGVVIDDDGRARDCEWHGAVYREFLNTQAGESGGYVWTCPNCSTENVWEGDDEKEDPFDLGGLVQQGAEDEEIHYSASLPVPPDLVSAVLIRRDDDGLLTAQWAENNDAVPVTRAELGVILRLMADAVEEAEPEGL